MKHKRTIIPFVAEKSDLVDYDEDDFLPERYPNECSECGKPIVKGSPYGVCESCRLGPI